MRAIPGVPSGERSGHYCEGLGSGRRRDLRRGSSRGLRAWQFYFVHGGDEFRRNAPYTSVETCRADQLQLDSEPSIFAMIVVGVAVLMACGGVGRQVWKADRAREFGWIRREESMGNDGWSSTATRKPMLNERGFPVLKKRKSATVTSGVVYQMLEEQRHCILDAGEAKGAHDIPRTSDGSTESSGARSRADRLSGTSFVRNQRDGVCPAKAASQFSRAADPGL